MLLVMAWGGLATLRSEGGRERLRDAIVENTRSLFSGELRIARIEGDFTSGVAIHGIEIRDREQRPAIRIGSVAASYSIRSLAERLHVDRIEIDRIEVQAFTTTTGINLAELFAPSPPEPEPSEPPEPLSLSIGSIRLSDASFSMDGEALVEDLDLSLELAIERGRIEARDLTIDVDGGKLAAERAVYDLGSGAVDAALRLDAPASLLAKLAKDPAIAADVRLSLTARHPPVGAWIASSRGTIANAPFTLSATASADFGAIDTQIALSSIDPHAAYRNAPVGMLDLSLDASMKEGAIAALLEGRGTLTAPTATLAIDRLTADAKLAEGKLVFAAAVDAESAAERAKARSKKRADRVRAEGSLRLDPMVIEEVKARAEIGAIAPYLPPELGLDASLLVDATASGPIDAIAASAKAEVRGVTMGDLAVARIVTNADLKGLPGRPAGRADLRITSVTSSAASLEALSLALSLDERGKGTIAIAGARGAPISEIDVQGNLQIGEGGRAGLDLVRAKMVYRGSPIFLAPTSVRYDPSELAVDANVSSVAGDLRARATIDPQAITTGKGTIDLRAPELSLAGIGSLLPEPLALAGNAALGASGRIGPDRNLLVELALDGVSYRGTSPIAGKVELALNRDLRGTVSLGSEIARVDVELTSPVPFDPAEWSPRDLASLTASIAPIDLSRAAEELVRLGGPRIELAGTATITASLRPSGDRFRIDAGVFGAVGAPVETKLALTASAAIPRDPSGWGAIDHRAISSARLAVDPIDARTLAKLGGVEGVSGGSVTLDVRAAAGLDRISLLFGADGVRLEALDDPIFAEVRADAVRHRIVANGSVRQAERPVVTFDATLGAGVGDFLDGAPITERAPISASLLLPGFPLAFLSEIVAREDAFAGTIVGTATVSGTIASPRARIDLEASEPRIGSMDFARFHVSAEYTKDLAIADVDLIQATRGALEVRSKVRLGDGSIDVNAKASRFAVDFVNDVIPENAGIGFGGLLSADLTMRGKPEDLSANGWLSLAEGKLLPPPPLQTIDALAVDVKAKDHAIAIAVRGRSGEGRIAADIRTDRSEAGLQIDGELTTEGLPVSVGRTPIALDLITQMTGAIGPEETKIDVSIKEGFVSVAEREAREVHDIGELEDVVFVDARGIKDAEKKERAKQKNAPKPSRTEIAVRTAKPLPVRSKDLTGAVEADIRISSGRVLGKVTLGDGALVIGSRSWTIERAKVDLDGSVPPRPVLDVRLVHEFQTVRVSIVVTGTPDRPEVRFESSPATYDQAALLAIVLGADPDATGDAPVQNKAAGAAANYLVGAIRSGVGGSLWLDTIAVEAGENIDKPKLQLGKWITREIFLGYEHNFDATDNENQAEAVLRYRFLPGWMIESRIGDKAQGLDLFWSKRF